MKCEVIDKNGESTVVATFGGWGELLDECANPPAGLSNASLSRSNSIWYGSSSFEEAMFVAKNGWKDGIAAADILSRAITTKMGSQIRKMKLRSDVEGGAFDVGAIVQNEPECWIRPEFKIQKGQSSKIIRVCVNPAASGDVNADTMVARGAIAVSLIKLLEQGGKRVEVWITKACHANSSSHRFEFHILIKRADQPLDLARMIFALAHPSMNRRLMFRLYELMPMSFQRSIPGYGVPTECKFYQADKKPDILIGHMLSGDGPWRNRTASIAWIKEKLMEQGVKIG